MKAHDAEVSAISARVKAFYEERKPFRIYHGATNSTRRSHRRADNTVDTSRLDRVLSIDVAGQTVLVEPNVAMDALVGATLAHGLVPLVVMEFPGITVGGGFSGTSGESSSFRHGPFDTTIASIEIVLPDGEIARASQWERQDLFWGAASAFGTLGVVTLLEVRLREARSHVRLEYVPSGGPEETVRILEEECGRDANEYVDGIVFSPTEAVICVGRMVDESEVPKGTTPARFSGRADPWFYLHVDSLRGEMFKQHKRNQRIGPLGGENPNDNQDQVGGKERRVDYIPLRDYLFRYDRGSFWVSKFAFSYLGTPFNRVTRCLLDPYLRARSIFRAGHSSGLLDMYMVQDVGVPYAAAADFHRWLDAEMGIYPLWLCPLRTRREAPDSAHGLHAACGMEEVPNLVNFGIWGLLTATTATGTTTRVPDQGQTKAKGGGKGKGKGKVQAMDRHAMAERNRALERKVSELGGRKCLYAQAFYEEDEFWALYDRASYDALRERYRAGHLPSVYDKVRVDVEAEERERERARRESRWVRVRDGVMGVWPMAGLKAMWYVMMGGEYLLRS